MKVIGLTGGIATGKTTVANYLKGYGVPVIDADVLAHQVVEPGHIGLRQLHELLGDEILLADGSLNRPVLAQKVFSDARLRQDVEGIIHPLVFDEIEDLCDAYRESGEPFCVIDMPLLQEVEYYRQVDEIWVVYVPYDIQLKRLMDRQKISREWAEQIISAQIPIDEKVKIADKIIDNTKSLQHTFDQVDDLLNEMR